MQPPRGFRQGLILKGYMRMPRSVILSGQIAAHRFSRHGPEPLEFGRPNMDGDAKAQEIDAVESDFDRTRTGMQATDTSGLGWRQPMK